MQCVCVCAGVHGCFRETTHCCCFPSTPGRFHLDLGNIFLDLMMVPRLHKEWGRQRRTVVPLPGRGEREELFAPTLVPPTAGHWDYSV